MGHSPIARLVAHRDCWKVGWGRLAFVAGTERTARCVAEHAEAPRGDRLAAPSAGAQLTVSVVCPITNCLPCVSSISVSR